jgi:menaquinone-dependent protoporphyrinogen oxidase
MTLLITYASSYGSTYEMARRLATQLQDEGHAIELCPVEDVHTLQAYEAVIVGSPIHCGLWARPMHQFLYRVRNELQTRPLYVWITCMRILEPEGYEHAQKYYVTPELRAVPSVRSIEVFAGRVVPSELSWQEYYDLYHRYDGEQTITYLKGDYREWARFREWGESIAVDLKSLSIMPASPV